MSSAQPVGLDPGYGNIKVCGPAGKQMLPSFIAIPTGGPVPSTLGLRTPRRPVEVVYKGDRYLVGAEAPAWGELIDLTEFYRLGSRSLAAAALAAISRVVDPSLPVALAMGVPVALLVDSGSESEADSELREIAKSVREKLEGEHRLEIVDGGTAHHLTINVAQMKLYPQPAGAWASITLDETGRVRNQQAYRSLVAVVDIGYNTVDLYGVQGGRVQPGMVRGDRIGVRRVVERMEQRSPGQASAYRLRQNPLSLDMDLVREWAAEVAAFVRRAWWRLGMTPDVTVFAGGGVLLLQQFDCLRMVRRAVKGHAVVHDDALLANADGLYRLAARSLAAQVKDADRATTS